MSGKKRLIFIKGLSSRPSSAIWLLRQSIGVSGPLDEYKCLLWVTKDMNAARKRADEIEFFLGKVPLIFPHRFTLPFLSMLPSPDVSCERMKTLYTLSETGFDSLLHVVAPVNAIMESTVPKEELGRILEYIEVGEETPRDSLEEWLVRTGYERTQRVERVGEYARRGEILDVFPPTSPLPVRILFFEDLVEEIRVFDPATQRSEARLQEFILVPASEVILGERQVERGVENLIKRAEGVGWSSEDVVYAMNQLRQGIFSENILSLLPVVYERCGNLLDYLPSNSLVIMDEISSTLDAANRFWERVESSYEQSQKGATPPMGHLEEYVLSPTRLMEGLRGHSIGLLHRPTPIDLGEIRECLGEDHEQLELPPNDPGIRPETGISLLAGAKRGRESLRPLVQSIEKEVDAGTRIVVATSSEKSKRRILSLFSQYIPEEKGTLRELTNGVEALPDSPGIYIAEGAIGHGFVVKDQGLIFLADHELFGVPWEARERPKRDKRSRKDQIVSIEELTEGDIVVHRDFGLGLFKGLVTVTTGDITGEYLLLEYRDGDKLYLPVDRIVLIQRYKGAEGAPPKLDKLGGTSWQATKKRVKKAIQEIANELVDLYALRQVKQGHAFSPPGPMYLEFEAEFPFEETPDQERAIQEILDDMQSPKPMDRLLCGDVGYGKTEVAMRAAFKAVEDGKQVCMLVPTTLLAEQHERTFKERFRRFPVNIQGISRLKSRREQRSILEGLKSGHVDIVIGTHRLLQSDCVFKDLGLLIIDEEHRFGVRHKERLKQLRQNVDCLSLTATPIPRTLQLSLLGIRDLSTIETSPKDRRPIKTFLAEYDPAVIREAILREMERGGQIFYVYNRVKGIERMAERLKAMVPELAIDVAHGQMEAARLEEVMIRFIRGEIDCLVSTTIIESGLDIPSANTMLIHKADSFGLAQLYQLRGRIGRSHEQAYAYLLVSDFSRIPKDARKRLTAILEMEERGGGLNLAMEDLKIRGAGNLLGTAQSGQIAKVGYDLFLELLKEAVDEMKGAPTDEFIHPEVNLKTPGFIPESYCSDVSERLRLYRLIGASRDASELEDRKRALEDIYGPVPQELERLFEVVGLKIILKGLKCIRLDEGPPAGEKRRFTLSFAPSGPSNPDKIIAFTKGGHGRLSPDGRLTLFVKDLCELKEILRRLL